MSFDEQLKEKTARAEQAVLRYLPAAEGFHATVSEAMRYSIMAGGKRLRPVMMRETYEMYGGTEEVIEPFMAAMEMIHTYSLVHDDLPAMDNDEYRRGRKTTHVVYGEAMAILAGDGLLTCAFETAASAFAGCSPDQARRVGRAIGVLAKEAGLHGMLGGQCADLEAERRELDITMERLLYIHENKTAAMLRSSLVIGAVLAGADEDEIKKLERIGLCVGIAFQIRDDILDIEGTQEELGKPIGSDEKNGKATYVSLVGMEQAKADVERYSEEALTALSELKKENLFLEQLIRYLISRKN